MGTRKWRVVCYVNQFFGQIGGEDMAHVGFSVKDKPVGPAVLFQNLLKNDCEVVGTIICGDNYFAENIEHAVTEGVELVRSMKPDLFIAGPAYNAGRYGISCGNMAAAVGRELGIPTVTGMYPENPAADLFRKDTYIVNRDSFLHPEKGGSCYVQYRAASAKRRAHCRCTGGRLHHPGYHFE